MDTATRFIFIPDVTHLLLAILALLLVWQYHNNQVLAGRIYAIDFWDMSGIRMFLHVTTLDEYPCEVCRQANGTVMLPSLALRKSFSTLPRPCTHAAGCRCLVVGLYGGWPEADRVLDRLRTEGRRQALKLSGDELVKLVEGPWHESVAGAGDELTMHMLRALRMESQALQDEAAMAAYRYVISRAKGARNMRLVVPAFLRLSHMLERLGHHEDAIAVIEQFEQRFPEDKRAFYFPSDQQRRTMAIRKFRLHANLSMPGSRSPANGGTFRQQASEASTAIS